MDRYGPRLHGVALALASDGDDAEDLLQEMWVVALRRRHTLRPEAAVGAWLYRILMNIGRGRARTRARRKGLLRRWWGGAQVQNPPELLSSSPSERVRSLLWREIAELPDLQRQVLLLRVVEEMSTAETAEAIDRAEGTVKASLHRAMKRLERRLGELGLDMSSLTEG
jgi:RNA polymerase sigma-70 factor (ECF subfamily)